MKRKPFLVSDSAAPSLPGEPVKKTKKKKLHVDSASSSSLQVAAGKEGLGQLQGARLQPTTNPGPGSPVQVRAFNVRDILQKHIFMRQVSRRAKPMYWLVPYNSILRRSKLARPY